MSALAVLAVAVAATLTVVVSGRSGAGGSRRAPTETAAAACGGWRIVGTRGFWPGGASIFSQIAAISAHDAWAVGTTSVNGNIRRTLTEHWDGSAWSRVPSPNAGSSDNGLNDAAGLGPQDVWAVGYSLQRDRYHPLALRWNGRAWSDVPTPGGSASVGTLAGVAASGPTDVWAVGHAVRPGGVTPLLLHWNGWAWSEARASGLGGASDAGLTDVAVASADDAWAVGYESGPGLRPLVLHWNGMRWSRVRTPSPPGQGVLASVSISPGGDVWAVGYEYRGITYRTLAELRHAGSWRIVPAPANNSAFSFLHGVAAVSNSNVWAVGTTYQTGTKRFVALSERWDGSRWILAATPNYQTARPQSDLLDGVAVVPGTDRLWTAGVGAGNTLAAARCAGGPADAPVGTRTPAVHTRPAVNLDTGPPRPPPSGGAPIRASGGGRPMVPIPRAVDRAKAAGVAEKSQAWTVVTADFNGDGWPDLFIGRHGDAARLYLNDRHGGFTRVDRHDFPGADRHGCAAADVNGDGRLDLFCGVGASHGVGIKRDELYLQRADGTFAEGAIRAGLMDPFVRTRRATFIDANGDGRPDLFVGGEVDRPDGLPAPNRLFLNTGNGSFHDAPGLGLDHQIGTLSVQAIDYNGDGRQDLLLASPGGLHLYRNDGPAGFTDVTAEVGLAGDRPICAQMADLDGDGTPDLVEVTPTRLTVRLQWGGSFHTVYTRPLTDATWVTLADVNGDHRPDIYVVQGGMGPNVPDLMLLNEGGGKRFATMRVPETSEGSGDTAYAIDYERNGLQAILVLNGHVANRQGPVQLITFSHR